MATENYTKLRDVVVPTLNEDGTYQRKRVGDTAGIYIERTGECRLFMFVPDFLAEFLESWETTGVKLEHKVMKQAKGYGAKAERRWAIIGRSPTELTNGYNKVCDAFAESKAKIETHPTIYVKVPSKGYSYHGTPGLHLEFGRYLRNTSNAMRGYHQQFEWEDDFEPRKKCSTPHDDNALLIPYDPAVWARLGQIKAAIDDAKNRLESLLRDKDAVQKLMSGNGFLQLGGPENTNAR